MADTTGFNLNILKKNLTASGKGLDISGDAELKSAYLQSAIDRGQFPSGIDKNSAERILRFYRGKTSALGKEDYAKDRILDIEIGNAVGREFVSDQFQNILRARVNAKGGKLSDEEIMPVAEKFSEKIRSDFAERYSRNPSQEEVASIFNQLQFPNTFLASTDESNINSLIGISSLGSVFENFDAKLPIIDAANLNLKNIGEKLSQDEIDKILARGLSPERADLVAADIISSKQEAHAKSELERIKPERIAAIEQLERDLAQSQGRYLEQDVAPSIIAALRSRGLAPGPELTSVLTEAGQKLGREREATIAPLRAQTALEAPEAAFNFALRGAAEAGKYRTSARDFLQSLNVMGKEQAYKTNELSVDRIFKKNMNDQNLAIQLALMGGKRQEPTALDYFLQYGLPVIGTMAGGWAGGMAAGAGGQYLKSKYGSGA